MITILVLKKRLQIKTTTELFPWLLFCNYTDKKSLLSEKSLKGDWFQHFQYSMNLKKTYHFHFIHTIDLLEPRLNVSKLIAVYFKIRKYY